MTADLRFETYEVARSREWMMRCGEIKSPQVIVLLPLLHEANRVRTLAAAVMRGLAAAGVATVLPDLPGGGESLAPLPPELEEWRLAVAAAARAVRPAATLSIRTGALLDDVLPPERRWRLSPATGGSLTRDLVRSRALAAQEAGRTASVEAIAAEARHSPSLLAGYTVPPGLFASLERAQPAPEAARTLRLAGDARPADARIAGPMLWRQAEPSSDPELVQAIVGDFLCWTASCAGF